MIHQKLSFNARKLLKYCHFLDNPIVFYHGLSGAVPTADIDQQQQNAAASRRATLAFAPTEILQANNSEQLDDLLRQLQQPAKHAYANQQSKDSSASCDFVSGWAGVFGYDAGQYSQANAIAQPPPRSDHDLPLAWFGYYPISLQLCLDTNEVILCSATEQNIAPWLTALDALLNEPPEISPAAARDWQPEWNLAQYQAAFERIQAYLRSGDCYQTNLTMPFRCADDLTQQSPAELLEAFDAPHSGFLKTAEFSLFTVSPERFVRIDQRRLETRPIKGTAPRSSHPEEDQKLLDALRSCPKNQAENLMIVDLLRNDLSRYATAGSVKVEALFAPQSHANVHHLVSTIVAELKPEISHEQAIFAALPGGSITGAPKRRAMEIINELEVRSRGFYCGSMGYFDSRGHSDFNILIRSIIAKRDGAECWGGGGIVLDSTADSEYQEILNKVQRIMQQPL
ncbi:aminodeoxychorismate synthase component I [Bacterioplanes sanyensis]|uniref:Aminodeoxychorismate synthase component I n=1 Tax=Bacterioplanes sanyensis TaxID=1249553 RepID=A0A222FMC6_9GAMM|nr:anthranilate synthase component I family protein [Bacterioplanes sanyensis]ASP39899.1 aminodeoxychorismate synthase component I [Bacterioplanes sanyensis]